MFGSLTYDDPRSALLVPPSSTLPSLPFVRSSDGSLPGSTACFDLDGTCAVDGNAPTIDASRWGSRDRSTNEIGSDDSCLGALGRVETWSVDDGQLTIGLPDDRYPFDVVLEPVG